VSDERDIPGDGWDDDDRAIARALDAAADAGPDDVDEQLVAEYREVLGNLSPEITPRADLEDDVVAAALSRRPATTPSVDRAHRRRANRLRVAVLAAALIAAVFVVALIVRDGSSGTPAPTAHVSLANVQRADVEALLRAPGTRSGAFRPVLPTGGKVALGANGKGIVYDLRTDASVSLGLISSGGSTVIGPARPVGGAIGFVVDHPERVTAVDLIRNGDTIGRAELRSS
jgi:hypothetical protein